MYYFKESIKNFKQALSTDSKLKVWPKRHGFLPLLLLTKMKSICLLN